MKPQFYCWIGILFIGATVAGCGGSGVDRLNLEGQVTFRESPVPYGRISFRPDTSKGGSGPAGVAVIRNGEYSTKKTGKGAVAGPCIVAIEGLVSDEPLAMPLFKPYKLTIDVSDDVDEMDFDVPAELAFKGKRR